MARRRRRKVTPAPVAAGEKTRARPRSRRAGGAFWLLLVVCFPSLVLGSYLTLKPIGGLGIVAGILGRARLPAGWSLLGMAALCLLVWSRKEGRRRVGDFPFWGGPALILTSVLLGHLSFPPVGWGGLGFVFMAPWLVMLVVERNRRALVLTWIWGYLHLFTTSTWIEAVAPEGLAGAAFLQGCYATIVAVAIRRCHRRLRLPLSLLLPVFWIIQEYWRSAFLFIKYPLCQVGYTQATWLTLIQIAELTSVYGVSFALLSVNGFLADFWKERRFRLRTALLPGATLLLLLGFGLYRLGPGAVPTIVGPRVAAVQGDLSQMRKNLDHQRGWSGSERLKLFGGLTRTLRGDSVDLLCWPETIFPMPPATNHLPARSFPGWGRVATLEFPAEYARMLDASFLYGQMHVEFVDDAVLEPLRWLWLTATVDQPFIRILFDPVIPALESFPRRSRGWFLGVKGRYLRFDLLRNGRDFVAHNSAFMVNRDGKLVGRYDKLCPVPISEYRPFEKSWPALFEFLGDMVPPGFTNYRAGQAPVLMPVKAASSGRVFQCAPTICWDTVFPEDMARVWAAGADFMVSLSNDAWFEGTTNPQMMLEATAFRAIEGRRGVVRAVNQGCSAFYDPSGRITPLIVRGKQYGERGALLREVVTSEVDTFYVEHGSLFCDFLVVVGFCLFSWSLFRRHDNQVT